MFVFWLVASLVLTFLAGWFLRPRVFAWMVGREMQKTPPPVPEDQPPSIEILAHAFAHRLLHDGLPLPAAKRVTRKVFERMNELIAKERRT